MSSNNPCAACEHPHGCDNCPVKGKEQQGIDCRFVVVNKRINISSGEDAFIEEEECQPVA